MPKINKTIPPDLKKRRIILLTIAFGIIILELISIPFGKFNKTKKVEFSIKDSVSMLKYSDTEILNLKNSAKRFDFFKDSSTQKFVSPETPYYNLSYKPKNLVLIENYKSIIAPKGYLLRQDALINLAKLAIDFNSRFNAPIMVVSSYRSYNYQAGLAKANPVCIQTHYCAKPGFSEHQSGLAVDLFSVSDSKKFLQDKKLKEYYDWLSDNAYKYGFHNSYRKGALTDGYEKEPWHWRFLGVELAKLLYENDLTFSEYQKKFVIN